MKKTIYIRGLGLFTIYLCVLVLTLWLTFSLTSCGSSGSSNDTEVEVPQDQNGGDITGLLDAPKMVVSYAPSLKDPVTDLADCIESVFDCMNSEIALKDCFATGVNVCSGSVPSDGCCMQACGDQLKQKLESGTSEQDAFLKVFVYDGSCMPKL
jgi:hypothetical protein